MIDFIFRLFLECKNMFYFFKNKIIYFFKNILIKSDNVVDDKEMDNFNNIGHYKLVFFKKNDVSIYQTKLNSIRYNKLKKAINLNNRYRLAYYAPGINSKIDNKFYTKLEFYFLRNKNKYGETSFSIRPKRHSINRRINNLIKRYKTTNIRNFINRDNINFSSNFIIFILKKYFAEIFFLCYFFVLLLLVILFFNKFHDMRILSLFIKDYMLDLKIFNNIDLFFNKFNLDINNYKIKKINKKFPFGQKRLFLLDRGPLKLNLKSNASYYRIRYTKYHAEPYFNLIYDKILDFPLFKLYVTPDKLSHRYEAWFTRDFIEKKFKFIEDIPSQAASENYSQLVMRNLSIKQSKKPLDFLFLKNVVIDNIDEKRPLYILNTTTNFKRVFDKNYIETIYNPNVINVQQAFEFGRQIGSGLYDDYSMFYGDFDQQLGLYDYSMFYPTKEYDVLLLDKIQNNYSKSIYEPKNLGCGRDSLGNEHNFYDGRTTDTLKNFPFFLPRKMMHKDNQYIRDYLHSIKESHSKLTLYYDFLQTSLLLDSFLSSHIQEQMTLMERIYIKQFNYFYRVFLIKECYFKSFVNLFSFFFQNKINIQIEQFENTRTRRKTTYNYRNKYYKNIYKFLINDKYLQYKYKIFLDLYIFSKQIQINKNIGFYFYEKNLAIDYQKFLKKEKALLFLTDKDYFIEDMIDFSLSFKAEIGFNYPEIEERLAIKDCRYVYGDQIMQLERFTNINAKIYNYYTKHSVSGERKDKFMYFFKYNFYQEVQFNKDQRDLEPYHTASFYYNKYVHQNLAAFNFLTTIRPLTVLTDIESPKYGFYDTMYTNKNLLYRTLYSNYKINVPDYLISKYFNLIYRYILKYDELRFSLNHLQRKYNFFKLLKKKYRIPLRFEKDVIFKLNFEFFPITYKIHEMSFNVINKYLYKDQKNFFMELVNPYNEFRDQPNRRTRNQQVNFMFLLLKISYILFEFKQIRYHSGFYNIFYGNFFLKDYLINEKVNLISMRQYIKSNLFHMLNNETIFFENYNYTTNFFYYQGRFSMNKKRSIAQGKQDDRYGALKDEQDPLQLSGENILSYLIYTQRIPDTKFLTENLDFKMKKGFEIFITNELHKKEKYHLFYWLVGDFDFYGNKKEIKDEKEDVLSFIFGKEVLSMETDSLNLLLSTSIFNNSVDTQLHYLFESSTLQMLNKRLFSAFKNLFTRNIVDIIFCKKFNIFENKIDFSYDFLLQNYYCDEKWLFSFDSNDMPNNMLGLIDGEYTVFDVVRDHITYNQLGFLNAFADNVLYR